LAGILGLPSIIFFGPTDPAKWKPYGPNVTTFRGDPISCISAGPIVQAISHESPKALCSTQND
jgi:ADP-heptose:LPS heptosyltransferase